MESNRRTNGQSQTEHSPSGGDAVTEPAIRVEGLEKSFGSDEDVTAVDGISFEIEPGTIVGLLGPNGAGKTTTIKSLLGLVLPDEGAVEICGIDVFEEPKRAHSHIGAMLEGERNVYWRLTVRENLAFFAGLGGQRPSTVTDRHEKLLDRLDLEEWGDTVVNELSKGMKQKVSLASTLAREVEVIFLDEPTLGLDIETSQELHAELRRLADEENVTIILTSHNMDVIEAVSDRVLIMQDGQIIADDNVANLVDVFDTQSYRITIDGPVPQQVRTTIQERPNVSTRADGEHLIVECHDMESETFYELIGLLEAHGQDLRGIESIDPDLGEIFLRLTGEDDARAQLAATGKNARKGEESERSDAIQATAGGED